jgi:glycosyltransferase involved in cell wall biosynthesis
MKIIFLSTNDSGGAGDVMYNLNDGLVNGGHQSVMLVKNKTSSSPNVIEAYTPFLVSWIKNLLDYLLNKLFPITTNPDYYFLNEKESFKRLPTKYLLKLFPFNPDVIIVGWVSGFSNTKNIYELKKATNARIIYFLTDMGNLTGGCHYDMHCNGYVKDCSNCPAILNDSAKKRAYHNLKYKKHYLDLSNAFVMPGSLESKIQSQNSFLFNKDKTLEHILAPVDTNIFNGLNKHIAKRVFNLNPSKKVIFAGSVTVTEKRKGLSYLYQALKYIEETNQALAEKTIVLLVGGNANNTMLNSLSLFEIKMINFIKDDRLLSLAFQSSDVFASSSVYDSGPLMVKQALCCSIPIVAFKVGACEELVINKKTGYICDVYDFTSFAVGITELLSLSEDKYKQISDNCKKHADLTCNKNYVLKRFIDIISY